MRLSLLQWSQTSTCCLVLAPKGSFSDLRMVGLLHLVPPPPRWTQCLCTFWGGLYWDCSFHFVCCGLLPRPHLSPSLLRENPGIPHAVPLLYWPHKTRALLPPTTSHAFKPPSPYPPLPELLAECWLGVEEDFCLSQSWAQADCKVAVLPMG